MTTEPKGQQLAPGAGDWVCPWGACNHAQAQECRAEMHPRNGCGGMFKDMTQEQAVEFVKPKSFGAAATPGATGDAPDGQTP